MFEKIRFFFYRKRKTPTISEFIEEMFKVNYINSNDSIINDY